MAQPMNADITQDDKLWSLLSWIFWPVGIVMLLMDDKKNRPFIKYNAVLSLAFWVVVVITGTITVGCLAIVGLIYAIVLGVQSFQGTWVKVPVLTDFVKKQGWA
jgi:uncharacterized protein